MTTFRFRLSSFFLMAIILCLPQPVLASDHIIVLCSEAADMARATTDRNKPNGGLVTTQDKLDVFQGALSKLLLNGEDGKPLYHFDQDTLTILGIGLSYGGSFRYDYLRHWKHGQIRTPQELRDELRRLAISFLHFNRQYTARDYALALGLNQSCDYVQQNVDHTTIILISLKRRNSSQLDNDDDYSQLKSPAARDTDEFAEVVQKEVEGGSLRRNSFVVRQEKGFYRFVKQSEKRVHGVYLQVWAVQSIVAEEAENLVQKTIDSITLIRQRDDSYQATLSLPPVKNSSALKLQDVLFQWKDDAEKTLPSSLNISLALTSAEAENLRHKHSSIQLRYRFQYPNKAYGKLLVEVQRNIIVIPEPIGHFWFLVPIQKIQMRWHGSQVAVANLWNGGGAAAALIIGYVGLIKPRRPKPTAKYTTLSKSASIQIGQSYDWIQIGKLELTDETGPSPVGRTQGQMRIAQIVFEIPDHPDLKLNKSDLLAFDAQGIKELKNLTFRGQKEIPVFLNKSAILDCTNRAINETNLTFTVKSQIQNSSIKRDGTILLDLAPAKEDPAYEVQVFPSARIEHRIDVGSVVIGELILCNRCPFIFSKSVEIPVRIVLEAATPDEKEGLALREKGSSSGGIRPATATDRQKVMPELHGNQEKRYDICIKFDKLPNPGHDKTYTFWTYLLSGAGDPMPGWEQSFTFTLTPDTRKARPFLIFQIGQNEYPVEWRENSVGDQIMPIPLPTAIWQRGGGAQELCKLRYGNLAVSGSGSVQIRATIARSEWPADIVTVGEPLSFSAGHPLTDMQKALTIDNGKPERTVDLRLDRACIQTLRKNPSAAQLALRFHGTATQDGNTLSWETPTILLQFAVERGVSPWWLSVDVGTAATVAAFSDNYDGGNAGLLDILEHFKNTKPNRNDIDSAEGAALMPSSVQLREGQHLNSKEIVEWYPHINQIGQRPHHLIPYLKKLIGFERVPIRGSFFYLDGNNNRVEEAPPLKETLAAYYRQLLDDIILPMLANQDDNVRQIILTAPNTFSPGQRKMIREIIQRYYPDRFEAIELLSESDAVAYYYLKNWQQLNVGRLRNHLQYLASSETILVYDMGAGTLDLTYIRIDKKGLILPTRFEILGRMGKSSAGNNIDFCLAQIIEDIIAKQLPSHQAQSWPRPTTQSLQSLSSAKDQAEVLDFKTYVRQTVKINLGRAAPNDAIEIQRFKIPQKNVTYGEVRAHPRIEEFIQENADRVLGMFFKTISSSTGGHLRIDTVLLSGRSVLFPGLREAIERVVATYADPNYPTFYPALEPEALKSAVTLGALGYVTSYYNQVEIVERFLYARYGFLYQDIDGNLVFEEFLYPGSPASIASDNVMHYSVTKTLDLRAAAQLILIQTYSDTPAEDYMRGDYSLITEIDRCPKAKFNQSQPLVTIDLDTEGRIRVKTGNYNWPVPQVKVDVLFSDPGYREGMWPMI